MLLACAYIRDDFAFIRHGYYLFFKTWIFLELSTNKGTFSRCIELVELFLDLNFLTIHNALNLPYDLCDDRWLFSF